ncbi:MAG: hypothetical protein RLZZ436_1875 [Planctomycetota bacterium]
MQENPWLPPVVREDSEPSTPLWRLFFGWLATGLSCVFAVSTLVFAVSTLVSLDFRLFAVIPVNVLMTMMLWRVGNNLRFNRPLP